MVAVIASTSTCEAVLTLRVTKDAVTYVIADGSAFDTNATAGQITVADMAASFGAAWADFNLGLTAASDVIHGNLRRPSDDGGRLSVTADFMNVSAGLEAITIAAAEVFDSLAGANVPINLFQTELSGNITASGLPTLSPTISATSHFSTGPLPPSPFDFGAYKFTQAATSPAPGVLGAFSTVVVSNPMGTHGLELAVGQNLTLNTITGDAGSVTLTTVVNPEPASLLLSCFGCAAFGFGYVRRRKVQEPITEV